MIHGADTSFLVAVEIIEHERHVDALRILRESLTRGDRVAVAPQVLAEFVHVVTDRRRFQQPMSMEMALDKPERWWTAAETDQVFPSTRRLRVSTTGCGTTKLTANVYSIHCWPRLIARRA